MQTITSTESKADRQAALMEKMQQKDKMEKEIMDITEYLESEGQPGLKGGLIDNEGFPRSDIDIVEIRKLRNRLALLQTDHTTVMKLIEKGLENLHETYIQEGAVDKPDIQNRDEDHPMTDNKDNSGIPQT